MEIEKYTIERLIGLKKDGDLAVEQEYQRAPVWTAGQKKLFIDSVMRDYPIPAFYFHDKVTVTPEKGATRHYFVIDGQQRIEAIVDFRNNKFKLPDPVEDKGFHFPNFVKSQPCPWAGKTFDGMSSDCRKSFLGRQVAVYEITENDDNRKIIDDQVRDIFIRLQNGTPLAPQDKRDAWPGKFTNFILWLGGKDKLKNCQGHSFFTEVVKGKEGRKKRQLAAQIAMLFISKRTTMKFVDIKSQNIDNFYKELVDFDMERNHGRSLIDVLNKIINTGLMGQKIQHHEAIGLTLLVDTFLKNYDDDWSNLLLPAFMNFRSDCETAEEASKSDNYLPHFTEYVNWIGKQTDLAQTITRRHIFFCREMEKYIKPTPNEKAEYTPIDRECIYQKYEGQCQVCVMNKNSLTDVAFEDMAIHCIESENIQDKSFYSNKALVESACLPNTPEEIESFRMWWINRNKKPRGFEKIADIPEGTQCKYSGKYPAKNVNGVIKGGYLVVGGIKFTEFSKASNHIAGTDSDSDGWDDWDLKLPGENGWVVVADLRSKDSDDEDDD